jgi:hypothetical protein
MTRIGCRAHDYGKLPAAALAATLRAKGYNAAQLAMPRAIAGIEDFYHDTDQSSAQETARYSHSRKTPTILRRIRPCLRKRSGPHITPTIIFG